MEIKEEDKLDKLKGKGLSDIIFPKIPLLNSETGKRQDGRNFEQVRPICLQANVRESTGSSLIEYGQTKILCVINGPKDFTKKNEYSSVGILNVEVQMIGEKMHEKDILLLKESLEAVIILEKMPKCSIDIYFTILEDDGSILAACVTAAGLALLDSGIPIYDTPIGCSLLFDGKNYFIDPTKSECQNYDMTDPIKNSDGGGLITMAFMPLRDQICLFTSEGKIDAEKLVGFMQNLTSVCRKILAVIREQNIRLDNEQEAMES